ncbi:MAG: hypothetical protein MUF25_19835, partial [Pirellulaceae bacterium]|nr:hypothetical protein [Pirellulaceae bacterium]
MIGSTWNTLFVAIAMGAGMFAQQAAHKVSAASEDKQVNSLVGLELFCSAEGYYLAGRFDCSTVASDSPVGSPVSPPADEQPLLVAANGLPADDVTPVSEPELDTAGPELELAAAADRPGVAEAPAVAAAETPIDATDATDASVATDAGATDASVAPTIPAPPLPDATVPEALAGAESQEPAAEMPEVSAPEFADDRLTADHDAEVLPPPAPDVEPRVGGDSFGQFADDASSVARPRSSVRAPLPPSIPAAVGRTYLDATAGQSSRYVTPSDLVRERAVARGEQRRQRIETRKWLGISPLRPAVDSTPFSTVEQPAQLILV